MPFRIATLGAALSGSLAAALLASVASAGAAPTSAPSTISGPITVLGGNWFTLQTPGRQVGRIDALEGAATRITRMDTPYVWGGGHAEAGVASLGLRGPGYTGHTRGYDCSGSVAAVLAAAGLWPAGGSVPADNGVIAELLAEHLIARGVGRAPNAVTLYDDPGVHIFMNINGRFFGTSDGAGGGDSRGGAGWLADGAWDASSRAFRKYHFFPSVLDQRTSDGSDYTFQLPQSGLFSATKGAGALGISLGSLGVNDLLVGERIRVTYSARATGQMVVQSVAVLSGGPVLPPPTATTPTTPSPTAPAPAPAPTSAPGATTPTVPTVPTVPVSAGTGATGATGSGVASGDAWGYGGAYGSGGWASTQAQAAISTTGGASFAETPRPVSTTGGGQL
ncbi:MAG TPA: hypothetical protein VFN48_08915 [Solirubrobacteraceae bacterium]|nr:hypothetical protein [Solirubrobacteraceae bacterium]